ncbi:MAG: DUF368 domain-containing protein [Acholeplasmataceae bacterium]|nr:DUF368 domain-containing protein [Acholeplasmataceae bacterium]MDD4193831.1 DUF368 domain-containing protein [Acholeplasmataceae bacterium]
MNHLIKIIKGSLVGMGSILPGVSGSMIAAIFNIYQSLVNALNDFTKHPIKAIKSVWQYIAGVIIGLFLGFFVINLFLDIAPLPITLLFIGFILGAIPSMIKKVRNTQFKWHHILVLLISMVSMISMVFIQENNGSGEQEYLIVFLIGAITAIALIIPGLSGATMLMALGFYQKLLDLIDDLLKGLAIFDFSSVLKQLPLFLLLVLGVVVGLILMGKVMFVLLQKYQTHFYMAVIGIVIVSPFNILFTLEQNTNDHVFQTDWYFWVVGLILCVIGFMASKLLSVEPKKLEE